MKFTIVTIMSTFAIMAFAQAPSNAGVAVNLPSLGQVLNAGSKFTITWTVDTNTTKPSTAINSVALMKGGSSNLEYAIRNILTSSIPVTPPTYEWNIPADIETNPSYVLALTGSNGATTYSTYFTIVGTSPGNDKGSVSPAANFSAPALSHLSGSSNSTNIKNSTSNANTLMTTSLFGAVSIAGTVALLL